MEDKNLIPKNGETLIGMHNGNFAYIKENEIRCVFESGAEKILCMPINKITPARILKSFNFNWEKATWREATSEKTV